MATFSTLAKCLIATVVVGGGVTGAVLGTTGSKGNKEEQVVIQSKQQEGHNNPFSSGVQSSGQSTELMDTKGDRPVAKEEKQLDQSISLGEDRSESLGPSTTPNALEKSAPNSEAKSVSLSKDQDLELKSTDREDPISKVVPEKEVKGPETAKENSTPPREDELKDQVLKDSAKRPVEDGKLPKPNVATQIQKEPAPIEPEENQVDPLAIKAENSTSNWFSIDLSGIEDFDEWEWPHSECQKDIQGDRALFTCPWLDDPTKMIELDLSLSSESELKGKEWKDVKELHFSATTDDFATLVLTFFDSPRTATLFLNRKIS